MIWVKIVQDNWEWKLISDERKNLAMFLEILAFFEFKILAVLQCF